MSLFKSQKAAAIFLAAAILIGTPLGMVRSLNSAAKRVERGFYDGVKVTDGGSAYTSAGIARLLEDMDNAANGLLSLSARVPSAEKESAALKQARTTLARAESIPEKADACRALSAAWRALYKALDPLLTDDRDGGSVVAYAEKLERIEGSIRVNPYNDSVEQFHTQVLDRFPASLVSGLVDKPDPFAYEEN